MSRLFYHTMQDNAGNLLFDVSGTMRIAGSGTLATIYGDEALTVILPNPMTNHPSYGSFKCFLGSGDYDFYMAKAGYTFETLMGVQGAGTMADQNASTVAITGGTAIGLTALQASNCQFDTNTLVVDPATHRVGVLAFTPGYPLDVNGNAMFRGNLAVGGVLFTDALLGVQFARAAYHGLMVRATDSDTGANFNVRFVNVGGTTVGSIQASATATAYNTSSDGRLKHDVETLTGELALMQALRPVSYKWNVDDSPGVGFLAQEVAAHVQGVITGEADAVDEGGGIIPQMIDHAKLVPYLVGAIKTLAARVALLEDALGV